MKILKNWFVLLMAVCVLGFSASAHAMEAPDALIKRISKEVLDAAKTNKELKKAIKNRFTLSWKRKFFLTSTFNA